MSDGFIIKKGGSGGDKYYSDFKAFVDRSITNVTAEMLQGVTNIGDYAFQYCQSLTSVTIPNSVTSISENAFSYCPSLASVTISSSVTSIGNNAFYGCSSLTSVTISNGVTSIEGCAFYRCTSLTSVTVQATTPPTLGSGVFDSTSSNLVIYVPAESVDAYKAANNWSTYASKIQAIPSE